jgi:hypothetical protein
MWILDSFDTQHEARIQEAIISARFGIPQLMFTAKNTSKIFTDDVLDFVWSEIGGNILGADMCLAKYGRDIRYPLFDQDIVTNPHSQSMKRPITVRACNLMDGVLVLPYHNKSHFRKSQWEKITVSSEKYDGLVYSLDVEKYHNYVADGILTKNCQAIYGFAGADSESLNNIAKEFNAVRIPLTVSYRCPKAVVAFARQWVNHIEAHQDAPEGSVSTITMEAMDKLGSDMLRAEDAIICRNTAPLVSLAFALIRRRSSCHVEGRDIGAGLIALAKRWKVKTVSTLRTRLEDYAAKQREKFMAQGKEEMAASLQDKVDTLIVIIDTLLPTDSVDSVISVILSLFGDTPEGQAPKNLTLCTAHRSKGREWHRVYLLGRNKYMPSKFARQDWQIDQEKNLIYVGVTRARSELIEVTV